MLDTNDKAPEFTLPDQNGHDISLTALLKDGPAILYFYPRISLPGCTT
jgi:peroxiredoxin Q/BCP